MKLLITGSRGFVGASLGRLATQIGHEVLGVGRATQPSVDWSAEYVAADVVSADLAPVIRAFKPEVIFHAAGTASVGASFAAPLDDLRASLLSWANLLDSVRRSGTNPLIFFPSTAAVYGQPAALPVNEQAEIRPISPYGFHKAACELIGREYAKCFEQRIIVCRLFSLFGTQQRRLLVWELYQQLAGPSDTVWLQGTGEETRDYLHANDMAAAIIAVVESQLRNGSASGVQVLNVASGVETRVMDLATKLAKLVAPQKQIRCRGIERAGDPERWQADTSIMRTLLPDWSPKPLAEGLAECVAGWRSALG